MVLNEMNSHLKRTVSMLALKSHFMPIPIYGRQYPTYRSRSESSGDAAKRDIGVDAKTILAITHGSGRTKNKNLPVYK